MIKVDITDFDSEMLKLVEAIKDSKDKDNLHETLQRVSNEFTWNALGDHTKLNWQRTDLTFEEYECEQVEYWKALVSDFAKKFASKDGLKTKCCDIRFVISLVSFFPMIGDMETFITSGSDF